MPVIVVRWVGAVALAVAAAAVAFVVADSEDSLVLAAAVFVVAGVAGVAVLQSPVAALVPLAAGLIAAPIDLAISESYGPFSDSFVVTAWAVLAAPAALIALLLGFWLTNR